MSVSESEMLASLARHDLMDARTLIELGHGRLGAWRIVTALNFLLGSIYRLGGSS